MEKYDGEKLAENKGREKEDEFFAIRHSLAEYKLDEAIVRSDNPEVKPTAGMQWFNSDLTLEGKKLAKEKAEEFFSKLDPAKDALFFVSSDLVRAAETAKIYLEVARERGFEIIQPRERSEKFPGNRRNKAEEISDGWVRKVPCLTLNHLANRLREFVFMPKDYLKEVVDPSKVSGETRQKWVEARKIIEADDRGSWRENYSAHSEEIEKIFPDVKSARSVYETKFLKMMQLIRFAQGKINGQNPEKNIKVLAFTHENSFIYFLNENFGESIKNCESIAFKIDEAEDGKGERIMATAKGQTKEVKDL